MEGIEYSALFKVQKYAEGLGIEVHMDWEGLNEFFKGDLDGQSIWIGKGLSTEEKLFNLLHLIGHTIQWNTDAASFSLGRVLHDKPDEKTISKLYTYEWQANCYGLFILEYLGFRLLKDWLQDSFRKDITQLINFYRTGEMKPFSLKAVPIVELVPLSVPLWFIPQKMIEGSRDGIVMKF